jgi:hypothetical protein
LLRFRWVVLVYPLLGGVDRPASHVDNLGTYLVLFRGPEDQPDDGKNQLFGRIGPRLHDGAAPLQQFRRKRRLIIKDVEIGSTVNLDLEPKSDPFIASHRKVAPENLFSGVEGDSGSVEVASLDLGPSQPRIELSGLERPTRAHPLQSRVKNFSGLVEPTKTERPFSGGP